MDAPLADDDSTWPCGLVETAADGVVIDVNETLARWTGRARHEMVGRRLRDLLSVGSRVLYETHVVPMAKLHGVASEIALDLLTERDTKMPVLVNVAVRKVDAEDRMYFSVVEATQRRSYERELLQARRQAEAATVAAERAQDRLQLLAEVNAALSEGVELANVLLNVASLIARRRQGVCFILTTALPADGYEVVAAGPPTTSASAVDGLVERLCGPLPRRQRVWPTWLRHPAAGVFAELPTDGLGVDAQRAEVGPMAVVPIMVRGRPAGAIVLIGDTQTAYGSGDLEEMTALSEPIGLHADNLRLAAGEHDRAMALQRALLTPAIRADGVEIATTYLPSAEHAMVGGDWYDSFVRPDGTIVLVIGDVTGHDHVAAAGMGQLRGLMRAVAFLSPDTPARVVSIVDDAARGLGLQVRATAILVFLSPPDSSGVRMMSWANAGHLPAALVSAEGTVSWLEHEPDVMLGVLPDSRRRDRSQPFSAGDTLVLYTDGLVESRTRAIDVGLSALQRALERTSGRRLPELCAEVVAELAAERQEDDIALLVVRN
jgi:serine phosphatase RsbU (regulator of sigma subunit)